MQGSLHFHAPKFPFTVVMAFYVHALGLPITLGLKVAGKLSHKRNNCFWFTPTIVQLVLLLE